jgi:hemerythrin
MSIVQWNASFAIGQPEIDRQHRALVEMIGGLQRSLTEGIINPQIGVALKELVHYTTTHFRDEQEIMRQIGYPELESQLQMHKQLTDQVVAILTDLKQGKALTATDLIAFLRTWLLEHILHEDKKIGLFIQEKTKAALTNS